jgi:hypothetical protein
MIRTSSQTRTSGRRRQAAQHILMSHSVVKNSFTIVLGHFPCQSLRASFLLSAEGFNDPEERKSFLGALILFCSARAKGGGKRNKFPRRKSEST